MQLDGFIDEVHDQLSAAAALGDERTQQIAATLVRAAAPAVRLAIMNALGEAADEITGALLDVPGSPAIAVRLDGDQLRVEVIQAEPQPAARPADEGEASARISLRLPETLKADIEVAAGRAGFSVNSWLVRAATDALAAGPGFPAWRRPGAGERGCRSHRVTGWING